MDRSQHDSVMLIGLIRHGGHPCGQHWLLSLIAAENQPQYICLLVLSGLVKVRGTRNSIVKINQTDFTLVTVFAIVTVIVFSLVHARLFRCSSVFTSCSSSPNIYLIIKPRFPQICTLFSSPSALLQKLGHWRAAYDIWLGEEQWRETIRRKNGRNAALRYLVTLVGRLVTTITPFSTVTPWLSVHLVHVPSQRKLFTSLDASNARVICCIDKLLLWLILGSKWREGKS